MTEYTMRDIDEMKGEIRDLKSTIGEFREAGCAIPRCDACGEALEDLYEDSRGHIHLACPNCDKVDYKDAKIKHKCGRRWLDRLAEEAGLDLEEDKDK